MTETINRLRFPGLRFPVPLVTTLALLAILGALFLPITAQAQTGTVLVTNLGETGGGARLGPFDHAQGFRTGANAAGYVLTSIDVKIHVPPPTGKRVTAEVWTVSGGVPSARHATLMRPASIVDGNNTFRAPAGTTLAGATTNYFVVLKSNDNSDTVQLSATGSDDQGPNMTDWRIADSRLVKHDNSTDWTTLDASNQSAQIRINGFTTESAPPYVTDAEVSTDGIDIELTFNEDLDHPTYGSTIAGAFTVTVNGEDNAVVGVRGNSDTVFLSVTRRIGRDQTVVVSYDESDAGSEALADSDDNEVGDFTTGSGGVPAVDNKSTLDAPDAPTGLTATALGATIVALAWTAPADDGGSAITGYRIEVSDDGSTGSWSDLVADTGSAATSYTDTGLSVGQTRHYRVSAINAVGTSDASVSDSATTQSTAPDPPAVSAIADGTSKIVVSWSEPANDGGSAITGYRLQVSSTGASGWSNLVQNTTATSHTHTGLSAGTTRHYRVYARNAQGESQPSDVVSDMTQPTATTCTEGPYDLWCGVMTVAAYTSNILNGHGFVEGTPDTGALSDKDFTVPPGTAPYTIEVVLVSSGTQPRLLIQLTSALSDTDQAKLVLHIGSRSFPFNDAAYTALSDIYQWFDTGLDWSEAGSITLRLRRAPEAPGAPTNLMAEADGGTRIELTWTAPADDGGSAITGYRIEVSDDGSSGSWSDVVANTGSTATSYTHTGLSPGDTRHYRVSAINPAGTSEASGSDDATTPDPPRLSSATVNTDGTIILLRFSENLDRSAGGTPPASAFSVSVDGVSITVGDAEIRVSTPQQVWLRSLGLTIYQGQNVIVTYTDPTSGDDAAAIQDSDGDDTPSFTTGRDGVPAVVNYSTQTPPLPAPTGFRAEPGDGEVTLSWDPPGSGSGVTHHDYRFKTDGSYGGWIEIDDSGPGETHASGFTVTTDIVNGTAHTFQLRAGGAGDSPAADSDEVTPMEASLAPPTNLRATPGDRQAVLTWTPPAADSGYTQHQYRYRAGDGNWERWTTIRDSGPGEANGRRVTVTGLANATKYIFELRASDGGTGRSPAATTDVTPQGPPRITLVAVTSSPGLDNGTTYGAGEEIRIAVTFDQDVEVTGNPRFRFDLGASDRQAGYDTGNGTETLVFAYTVRTGDRDDDGIGIGANVIRLNGGGIGNGAGHDAQLAHDGLGTLSRHKVNGARQVGMHEHAAFTHGHSYFNDGKRYYTEEYPSHEHEGHEHPDEANDHRSLNGPLEVHTHHLPENPNSSVSGGPDERGHGGVEHVHRCFDLKPSCNKDDYSSTPGLPIEVTHSHAADSEPGHGFDWEEWFAGRGPDATGAVVSVADAEAVGGEDAHLRFVVTLEPALAFAVRVDYATADATATAGEDYRETSGVLEIPPGETRATVRVPVRDRAPTDGDETLTLTLGSATAARVADGEATGTIRAPEATPPPEIDDINVVSTPRLRSDGNEKDTYGEGENIRIEVEFDQLVLVEGDPVMMLEVCDPGESLCEAEARYESGSGTDTLVFAYLVFEWDRDRNGIAIPADPIDVSIDDFDGFRIRNDAGQEADLSYRREGTKSGHKVDGERQAGQYLWVEDAEAHEADGEMTFTVRLEPRGLGIVTVDYATRDGSARAGSDYTQTSGRLRFNPLERERTVTVPIIDDAHQDDRETFRLRLSNPDGALLGDREATGTIRNSDPVALSASFPASAYASASHSGAEDRPQAVVEFSQAVAEFEADTPSVSVTGGAVASVQPHTEDGLEHAWLFVLAPDGNGDVTFALVADAACAEGGICTPGGSTLKEAPEASTIPGPGEAAEPSEPPDKPRGLDATATHDAITLTWDDPDDDSITGYVILRRLPGVDQEGHFNELVANTGSAATNYTDDDVAAETRYTYRIKAINEAGTSERSRWFHIDTPAAPEPDSNSPATGAPAIAGTAQVGERLTVDTSGIADEDGLGNVQYEYQWLSGGTAISGATASAYTPAEADEGKAIKVQVSFTDDAGNEETLTSAATAAVAARPAPLTARFPVSPFQSSRHQGDDDRPQVIVAFNQPVQSFTKATPSVSLNGATALSAARHQEDGLENAWIFWLDPEGGDDLVFTLVAGQSCDGGGICTGDGRMLSQGLSKTLPGPEENEAAEGGSQSDDRQANSPATGAPTINGTAQVGETLTADTSSIADEDGLEDATFTYQWLGDGSAIQGATARAYTLTDSDEGKAVRVRVSFSDDAGNGESLNSAATDAVAAEPSEPPDKPRGLSATASHHQVVLTWDDPGDDSITGYVILRRLPGVDQKGQFDELVADTGTAATTYTDGTVAAETRYTYRIKAINEHGTSERSRWYHIDTPAAP